VVESKSGYVQNTTRTMLLAADLHPKFWTEVVGAIVYTINRAQL